MTKAKELLAKIKAMVFDDQMPPAPPAPAPLAPPSGTPYTLQDGTTVINIVQAGDTPAVGDMVTINGAPAPASSYTLQDGSTLTTDATGAITAYTAAAPVTVDPVEAAKTTPPPSPAPAPPPAAPPAKFELTPETAKAAQDKMTPEAMAAMFEAFATGSSDDRIANLELVCKALMEYNFGWQIREQQQKATTDAAINIYKADLVTAQAALASQKAAFGKQEDKLKIMLELMEQLVDSPTAEPTTVPDHKKEKFDKQEGREARLERMGKAISDLKASKK